MSDSFPQANKPELNHPLSFQVSKFHQSKHLKILVLLFVLGTTLLNGYFFWENMNLKKQLGISPKPMLPKSCEFGGVTYQPGESVPSIDDCNSCACDESGQVACTAVACEKSNELQQDTSSWKLYNNLHQGYSIRFPNDRWELLTEGQVPIGFRYTTLPFPENNYPDDTTVLRWLKNTKMFNGNCPDLLLLKNINNPKVLIAFDKTEKDSHGGSGCVDLGSNNDLDHKWRVADKITTRNGSSDSMEVEWYGDFLVRKEMGKNYKGDEIFAYLANVNTFNLNGMSDFEIIVSSLELTQ